MVALMRANRSRTHPQIEPLVPLGDGVGVGGEVESYYMPDTLSRFIPYGNLFFFIIISAAMGQCKYPHNVIRLTEETGNLLSPLYPRKFHDKINYTWVITAPEGNFVKLRIKSFDFTSCALSFLTIRDGPSSSSVLLKSSCKRNYESTVFSSSHQLWVQFISTQNDFGAKFYAEFEVVKQRKAEIFLQTCAKFYICFLFCVHKSTRMGLGL